MPSSLQGLQHNTICSVFVRICIICTIFCIICTSIRSDAACLQVQRQQATQRWLWSSAASSGLSGAEVEPFQSCLLQYTGRRLVVASQVYSMERPDLSCTHLAYLELKSAVLLLLSLLSLVCLPNAGDLNPVALASMTARSALTSALPHCSRLHKAVRSIVSAVTLLVL